MSPPCRAQPHRKKNLARWLGYVCEFLQINASKKLYASTPGQLNKAEYLRAYQRMADDTDRISLAEEGMSEYYRQINEE
jgi:hypothetical protein